MSIIGILGLTVRYVENTMFANYPMIDFQIQFKKNERCSRDFQFAWGYILYGARGNNDRSHELKFLLMINSAEREWYVE